MSDFPKRLYRDGTEKKVWGRMVDTLTVETAEAEAGARADGWRGSPLPEEAPQPGSTEPAPEAVIADLRRQLSEAEEARDFVKAELQAANDLLSDAATADTDLVASAAAGEAETFTGATIPPSGYSVREVAPLGSPKRRGRPPKEPVGG